MPEYIPLAVSIIALAVSVVVSLRATRRVRAAEQRAQAAEQARRGAECDAASYQRAAATLGNAFERILNKPEVTKALAARRASDRKTRGRRSR